MFVPIFVTYICNHGYLFYNHGYLFYNHGYLFCNHGYLFCNHRYIFYNHGYFQMKDQMLSNMHISEPTIPEIATTPIRRLHKAQCTKHAYHLIAIIKFNCFVIMGTPADPWGPIMYWGPITKFSRENHQIWSP
jgi:hypothetical protein